MSLTKTVPLRDRGYLRMAVMMRQILLRFRSLGHIIPLLRDPAKLVTARLPVIPGGSHQISILNVVGSPMFSVHMGQFGPHKKIWDE